MSRLRLAVSLIALVLVPLAAISITRGANDTSWKAPFFLARKKNPIKADASSIQRGKALYVRNCTPCHGTDGKGDGPQAKDLNKPTGDLTADDVAQQKDGALFYKITEGRSPMPSFRTSLSSHERWDVINYIRTFCSSAPSRTQPKRPQQKKPEYSVSERYRNTIAGVLGPYLELGTNLSASKLDAAAKARKELTKAVTAMAHVDAKSLAGDLATAWKASVKTLQAAVHSSGSAKSIDEWRASYRTLSDAIIATVSKFGYSGDRVVRRFHCPKAFDGHGASWLQTGSKPQNPYVADSSCGESKEVYARTNS